MGIPTLKTAIYIATGIFVVLIPFVFTTNRYYGTYTVFGTVS